jgi:hypothetical protein
MTEISKATFVGPALVWIAIGVGEKLLFAGSTGLATYYFAVSQPRPAGIFAAAASWMLLHKLQDWSRK